MTQAARPWLAPLTTLYRLGIALRGLAFRSGLEPVRRLGAPVVSIGNLSTGGAGKTPLAIALARALAERGLHVDVLSRGYGRTAKAPARVDPNGTAEDFGDEPLVIAREAGIPVYVAAQRYQAGLLAEQDAASDPRLHLLDDGFQHRQLHRDVDILLVAGADLQDRLLPAGNLREPLDAIGRATVVALTMPEAPIPGAPSPGAPSMEQSLRSRGLWQGPVWRLRRRMMVPPIEGPVVAFCGIARPGQFFAGLEDAGLHVASRIAFADHQRYDRHDIDCILEAARTARAAALITTEKDRVRLTSLLSSIPASLPLETAGLRIEIEGEDRAIEWLLGQLPR
ncbi:MAG: tetraacyldisaccharide 4'-kinase [Terracidiphilus sp.]